MRQNLFLELLHFADTQTLQELSQCDRGARHVALKRWAGWHGPLETWSQQRLEDALAELWRKHRDLIRETRRDRSVAGNETKDREWWDFEFGDSSYNVWIFDLPVAVALLGRIISDLYLRMRWPMKGSSPAKELVKLLDEEAFVRHVTDVTAEASEMMLPDAQLSRCRSIPVRPGEIWWSDSRVHRWFGRKDHRHAGLSQFSQMLEQRPYLQSGPLLPRRPAPVEGLSLRRGQESVFMTWDKHEVWVYGSELARQVELIPLEELGRPRVDVVCNCSGVFRDLFINQMNLLDRAIKAAAEADEPLEQNFVRKHAMEQAEELNISLRQAATRVFSNAAGSYSANVGIAIENGANVDEDQLQEQFVTRKGFALSSDAPGELQEASGLFKSALSKVDVTFQNLDSSEISLTDVSHYFDNDPTKVVSNLRKDGKKPASLIADTTTANAQVRSLSAQVRLDSRTKLLNPKFYESNLNGGYEGVREISKRMRFTFGWSTTADAVDNFVYEDCNTTYIQDEEIKNRMLQANPDALRDMVQTFLEANAKGSARTKSKAWTLLHEGRGTPRNLVQSPRLLNVCYFASGVWKASFTGPEAKHSCVMKHGSVYLGGLSRGDTPPKEIPTVGAGGRPKISEMTKKEMEKGCPYARDENARCPARHEGMALDVISKLDVPPGPLQFHKDMVESCACPVDVDMVGHGGRTNSYQFTSSEVPVQPDFRTTGRCAMDCSDIEGTWPHPLPAKSVPQDPMKIEDEFRNPRHHSVLAAASASLLNTGSLSARGPRASERAGLERWEVNPLKVGQRQGHPLSPRYHLPVAEAGTSMHVRFQCERHDLGDHPPPTQGVLVGGAEDLAALLEEKEVLRGGRQMHGVNLEARMDALQDARGTTVLHTIRARVLKASEQLQTLAKLRKVEAGKAQRDWERKAMCVLVAWAFPELLAEAVPPKEDGARKRGRPYALQCGSEVFVEHKDALAEHELLTVASATNGKVFWAMPATAPLLKDFGIDAQHPVEHKASPRWIEASTRLLEAETKSSPPAEGAAQLCMVVIGIGYLFPIAAIWAAFDYWKLLFPDQNVEFAVTALYQAGSILTVIALSFVETFQFGPRILGGFGGQFLCLSAILAFKWLPWSPSILYDLLLGVVLLCSVATGYLDSALLSLCSQYSSKMQAYLQIGLGFGTLVSVAYRDVTKLVSSEVSVASTAFFVVALATVLVCISAYRLLMLLPASRHLSDAAPGASSYGAVSDTAKGSGAASGATVGAVLSVVWFNQLVIFGNFFLTTLCYPGLITAIPCKQMKSLDVDQWFQTILLTVFAMFDIVARFCTHIRFGLDHGNIQYTVLLRALLVPLMLTCAVGTTSDLWSMVAVAAFGLLNGYSGSLCLVPFLACVVQVLTRCDATLSMPEVRRFLIGQDSTVNSEEELIALLGSQPNEFPPRDVTDLMWDLARTQPAQPRSHSGLLVDLLHRIVLWRREEFAVTELAEVACALASARVHEPEGFHQLGEAIYPNLQALPVDNEGGNLCSLLWAFSEAGILHGALFDALVERAVELMVQFQPKVLSDVRTTCFWSFRRASASSWGRGDARQGGRRDFASSEFYDRLVPRLLEKIDQIHPISCVYLMWSFAKPMVLCEELFNAVASRVIPEVQSLDRCALAMFAWNYAYINHDVPEVYQASAKEALRPARLEELTPRDLANLMRAFAKAGVREVELMQALSEHGCGLLRDGIDQKCYRRPMKSLAREIYEEDFSAVDGMVDAFDMVSLAEMLSSFADQQYVHHDFLSLADEYMMEGLRQPKRDVETFLRFPQVFARALVSRARAYVDVSGRELFQQAMPHVVRSLKELKAPDVLSLVVAWAMLGPRDPDILAAFEV
eukprot:g13959.t1